MSYQYYQYYDKQLEYRLDWLTALQSKTANEPRIEAVFAPMIAYLIVGGSRHYARFVCTEHETISQQFRLQHFHDLLLGKIYTESEIRRAKLKAGALGDQFFPMRQTLDLAKWRSQIVSADCTDDRGRPYIPAGLYSPFRPHRAKMFVAESPSRDMRIIIPCSEIIRECFGPTRLLLRLVLTGQFLFTYSAELSFFQHKDYDGAPYWYKEMFHKQDPLLVQNELRRITLRAIAYGRTEGHYSIAARLPFAGEFQICGAGLEYCVESIISKLFVRKLSFAPA
jgi:hypothetical protein